MRHVNNRYSLLLILLLWTSNAIAQIAPTTTAIEPKLTIPSRPGSVKILVFGDSGRGSESQYQLAQMMVAYRRLFPFTTALMTGDNIYGSDSPSQMKKKFDDAYRPLIDSRVKFYASLGNHDDIDQRNYPLFNMQGRTYYRVDLPGVSIYALDSNRLDATQLEWLSKSLETDANPWRLAFFHHPPFSSSQRHGSDPHVAGLLHPIFVKYHVSVVFNGHDHVYERIQPQDGIQYFVTGAGGKIRSGDVRRSDLTAAYFDADLSFMLVEIAGDDMFYQVIARDGRTVDSGKVKTRD